MTEREASTTKEAAKDVKEVAEGLGIRQKIMCENDDNAEEKDVATNEEVPAEEATKDVGTVATIVSTILQKQSKLKFMSQWKPTETFAFQTKI